VVGGVPWPEPAPEVVAAVRAAYRRREVPLPVGVRDRLGRPALVTVLQMTENLTDRHPRRVVGI
jgi:hypothetical protein